MDIDRREFLKGAAGTLALLMSARGLSAAEATAATAAAEQAPVAGPPVRIGVVGLGQWGRDLVTAIGRVPSAEVAAVCDTYSAFVTRAKRVVPDAAEFEDYRKLLESPEVEAVIVATPSHLHKDIVLDALQAGKHVYCEAPLASSVDDAKTIALAGNSTKQVFQVGQQGRSNPMYRHVDSFVKAGCLGRPVQAQAQWHKKQSWRRMAPTPEREKELNWRLSHDTSAGLIGELSIHQIDLANWYMGGLPVSVTGFGQTVLWDDGREVPDTVQCLLEYPSGVRLVLGATIANSFSGDYVLFQGSDSSLVMRSDRGWMVKETDAPLLGWEVYAKKEECFGETGICMLADATQILRAGDEPGQVDAPPPKDPLDLALEDFTRSIRESAPVACGALHGYQAAVAGIKANRAAVDNTTVACRPQDYELG